MIVTGMSWITEQACGSLRRGWQKKFEDPKALYQQLEQETFFTTPISKVRWFNTVSQRYCLAAALALRDSFENASDIRSVAAQTGLLSLNRDGALQSNVEYFKDYVDSGRTLARGNLFIHTLPTSPLAEVAITFGFKGPIFHLSAAKPQLNLLLERSEALSKHTQALNLLCCIASQQAIICFFLRPNDTANALFSIEELKSKIGSFSSPEEIFKVLKIETEAVRV